MDNNNTQNEKINDALPETEAEQTRTRPPLVLPEEDFPVRKRPPVTEEDVKNQEDDGRARPAVSPEDISGGEERQIHDGRITGEKHSEASTAAPVRTRTPEKNREITNGIPTRHSAHSAESVKEAEQGKEKGKFTPVWAGAAVLCVLLMLTVVVFTVNNAYRGDSSRPADFSMGMIPEGDIPRVDSMSFDSLRADGDSVSETAEAETGSDTAVSDTEAGDTESDSPAETAAPETALPETRYTVTIKAYNRDPITVTLGSMTVGELFDVVGFKLRDNDRMYVETDSIIAADTEIVVDSVEYRTVDKTEPIPFTTITNDVRTVPRGQTAVAQNGEEGINTLTYEVEFINGQEVARTLINEVVTKEPVTQILERGIGGELMGSDGVTYTYSHYKVVPATYYNIEGLTWAGTNASENTIATNFNYIPLGTKLYVKNDKFDFGVRTVEDTGTMEGYEVDIWISADNPQLAEFARIGYHYDMVIYYLD
ncbi:MAG: hypothetical protein E7638_05690 [Ruminococcaceae bacterium]|nr:hypothetical protein [Oscillospiraceae bacterium]